MGFSSVSLLDLFQFMMTFFCLLNNFFTSRLCHYLPWSRNEMLSISRDVSHILTAVIYNALYRLYQSCKGDLVRENGYKYFLQVLSDTSMPVSWTAVPSNLFYDFSLPILIFPLHIPNVTSSGWASNHGSFHPWCDSMGAPRRTASGPAGLPYATLPWTSQWSPPSSTTVGHNMLGPHVASPPWCSLGCHQR